MEFPSAISGHMTNCPDCGKQVQLQEPNPAAPYTPPVVYRVVPFKANIKEGGSVFEAGEQLEKSLNTEHAEGWEYVKMEQVSIAVQPAGCLGAFLGRGSQTVTYDYIVYRRKP